MLSNIMSLSLKVDELAQVMEDNSFDIVFITESWLNSNIPDDVIQIEDYRVFRRDRERKRTWRGMYLCKK